MPSPPAVGVTQHARPFKNWHDLANKKGVLVKVPGAFFAFLKVSIKFCRHCTMCLLESVAYKKDFMISTINMDGGGSFQNHVS